MTREEVSAPPSLSLSRPPSRHESLASSLSCPPSRVPLVSLSTRGSRVPLVSSLSCDTSRVPLVSLSCPSRVPLVWHESCPSRVPRVLPLVSLSCPSRVPLASLSCPSRVPLVSLSCPPSRVLPLVSSLSCPRETRHVTRPPAVRARTPRQCPGPGASLQARPRGLPPLPLSATTRGGPGCVTSQRHVT